MINLWNRLRLYSRAKLNKGFLNISWNTQIRLDQGALVEIENGVFRMGYPTSRSTPFPSNNGCLLKMGKNARLIARGNVFIANGCSIVIADGGEMMFEGNNVIARNAYIRCHKKVVFGQNAAVSWNCSLLDWDGHEFERLDGQKRMFYKPLMIGKNVGIQMNVVIPRGVTVGSDSIISANTVLRTDVPEDSLVFANPEVRIKSGYRSGLGSPTK